MPFSGESARRASHDAGVSPVIGMILVLAVSVVGIAATLYWGLPAVDEMKADVEVKAVRGQMTEFLGDVSELATGSAGKTAKHFQPQLQRGSMSTATGTEQWLIAADYGHAFSGSVDDGGYNFTWAPDSTNAHNVKIYRAGSTSLSTSSYVSAYLVLGTAEERVIITEGASATCPSASTMTGFATTWNTASSRTFAVCRSVGGTLTKLSLAANTLHFDIYDAGTAKTVASAWVVNAGQFQWVLKAGVGQKELIATNAALIEGSNGNYVFRTAAPIPPPKVTAASGTSPGSHRWFGRIVELNGTASFGGQDRFDMILNLYGTASRRDTSCDRTVITSCVVDVKIYNLGTLKSVWQSYFTNSANGYSSNGYVPGTILNPAAQSTDKYVQDKETKGMSFTLLHSVITASG